MPMRFEQGDSVGRDGEYRIDRLLGDPGGFGQTYKAVNLNTTASVALKFLNTDSLEEARREGQSVAGTTHEAVVRVLDVVEWDRPFVVMEFVGGQDLSTYLEQSAPLTSSVWWQTLRPLLSGLQHLHARGVVHRDIKPANIVLRDGKPQRPVIVDFGAARREDQELSQIIVARAYADPEIVRHEPRKPEPNWDIYSLAVVSFEALFRDSFEDLQHLRVVAEAHRRMRQELASSDSTFCQAIGKALEGADQRPQQVVDWLAMMVQPDGLSDGAVSAGGSSSIYEPPSSVVTSGSKRHTVAAKCRELERRYGLPERSVQLTDADGEPMDGRTSLVSFWEAWEQVYDEFGVEFLREYFGDDETVKSVREGIAQHLNYPTSPHVISVAIVGPDGELYGGGKRVKTLRRDFATTVVD